MKSKLKFRVRWKAKIDGIPMEGIEEECSWFLVTQQGTMLVAGPMQPIKEVSAEDYQECEPLIKIGDEWLSVDEIEEKLLFVDATEKSVIPWECISCGKINSVGSDICLDCHTKKGLW